MNLPGHVHNGVVVFDGDVSLPEGAAVMVTPRAEPSVRTAENPKRVEFPLVPSKTPGAVPLTNERIGELLDEEDVEAIKRSRDVSA